MISRVRAVRHQSDRSITADNPPERIEFCIPGRRRIRARKSIWIIHYRELDSGRSYIGGIQRRARESLLQSCRPGTYISVLEITCHSDNRKWRDLVVG